MSDIERCAEWRLLHSLYQHRSRIAPPVDAKELGRRRTKTSKRRNGARQLSFQIHRLFEREDLHLVLSLLERDDDDDTELVYPVESNASSTTSQLAITQLETLCDLLDKRVNINLTGLNYQGLDDEYPKLESLVQYLQSPSGSQGAFGLVTRSDSIPVLFAFPIGTETDEALSVIDNFNSFVDGLSIDDADMDQLNTTSISAPIRSMSMNVSATLDDQGFGHRFQGRAIAAFRAIFSNFSTCQHQNIAKHNLLLRLPTCEEITADDQAEEGTADAQTLVLFLDSCPEFKWQEARAQLKPKNAIYHTRKLCDAINDAIRWNKGLDFYFDYADHPLGPTAYQNILVPLVKESTAASRCYGTAPANTLRDLLRQGDFKRLTDVKQLERSRVLYPYEQRKPLAVKLILGLMMSLGSRHAMMTWDAERIYLFAQEGGSATFINDVFVSCGNLDDISSELLALPKLDSVYEQPSEPFRVFTNLAKVLLEIALGDTLDLDVDTSFSQQEDMWKYLCGLVDSFKRVIAREAIDLRPLPFLEAAQACLDFHLSYQYEIKLLSNQPGHKAQIDYLAVAKQLIYDGIICKIDKALSRAKPTLPLFGSVIGNDLKEKDKAPASLCGMEQKPRYNIMNIGSILHNTTQRQKSVELFHSAGKVLADSEEAEWGRTFFNNLEIFRSSFGRLMDRKNPRRPKVAIIDTGVDKKHIAIDALFDMGRMRKEWCRSWVGDPDDVQDEAGHGTDCAYVLSQTTPETDICVAKVFSETNFRLYQAQNIADAIHYAVKTWKVDIISMSFGLRPAIEEGHDMEDWQKVCDDIENALDMAVKEGKMVFVAASNSGKGMPRSFPATLRDVFAIHASKGNGADGDINAYRESGDDNFMTLGIAVELLHCYKDENRDKSKLVYKSGTSLATPIAAGIAATILEVTEGTTKIYDRARKKLWKPDGMRTMFRMMSHSDELNQYRFVAPWYHWPENWQLDEAKSASVWQTINSKFNRMG